MFVPLEDKPQEDDVPADPRRGFVEIAATKKVGARGFVPIETAKPSVLASVADTLAPAGRTLRAMADPLALMEAGTNLVTGAAAMPVAGLAGIGAAAAGALGADVDPAAVVHKTADALTYKPRSERGETLARAVMYPFEKLSEGARKAGETAQDAGASPGTATAVETAIAGALPLAIPVPFKSRTARPAPARTAVVDLEPARAAEPGTPPPSRNPADSPSIDVRPRRDPAAEALSDAVAAENTQHAALRASPEAPEHLPSGDGVEAARLRPSFVASVERAIAENRQVPRPEKIEAIDLLREAGSGDPKAAAAFRQYVAARPALVAAVDEVVSAARRQHPPEPVGTAAVGRPALESPEPVVGHAEALSQPERAPLPAREPVSAAEPVRVEGRAPVDGPPARVGEPARPAAGVPDLSRASEGFLRIAARSEGSPVREHARAELLLRSGERAQPETLASVPEIGEPSPAGVSAEPVVGEGALGRDVAVEQRATMSPGAQHVGFIDDTKVTSTHTPKRPIRREDILAPLAEALNLPLYEGRIKEGKVLGFYVPGREVTRIKHKSDMETTAHEIAHAIDDRIFNGFGKQKGVPNTRPWMDGTPEARGLSAELRGVSYDRSKSYEGFAEFVRLWMTQPERARAVAPKFNAWFDEFVSKHEYGPALAKAREGMTQWYAQDALSRARSKIGEAPEINAFMDGLADRFRQSVADDLHGVYRMERELKGGIEPRGAYETARLTRAAASITEGSLLYGTPFRKQDGSFGFVGKGLKEVLAPVTERLDDFLAYSVGRSARELMSQGREHLFTPAEVRAMVALETPEFKAAFEGYQRWNEGILDFAEQHGLISGAVRAKWQRTEYIPFHRVGTHTTRAQGGMSGNWSGIKTLTGGTENIRDVLGNIIGNASTLIDAALKNDARMKIAAMAEKTRGGGHFMAPIPPESRLVKIDKTEVKDRLIEAAGGNPRNPPPQLEAAVDSLLVTAPHLMDFLVKNQAPTGGNIVAALKNGSPRYYEVADPILYRALTSLDRPAQSTLVKWLAMPKRVGQASITLTPDFMVRNIARDTLMGAIMSRAGFRPAIDSIRGLVGRMNSDPSYVEYIANGGGFSSYLVDEAAFKHHLAKFYEKKSIHAEYVLDAPSKFLTFVERIADSFEVATRLGEYKRLREQGVHPRHAAYLSREVSTDFAMKGDNRALGFMYDTVMFLRPAVVSLDRIYRGLAHDPNSGAIAAKSGAVALASAGLYLLNRDNPKFQDLPDWDRDSYWHFFVPSENGEELHFRYPRIWEVGALATLAERSLERTLASEPKELTKDFARTLKQSFMLPVMPQAFAPVYEQAMNRDTFTGRPIETQGMEELQPFLRVKPGTSETMRALGMASRSLPEALQVNPSRAEALLTGYLNTWATYGLMLADEALFHGRKPERRLDQMPVVKSFYREEPPLDTKYTEEFYRLRDEARRLRNTMRKLDRLGQKPVADEFEAEPLATKAGQLDRAEKSVAVIRAEIEQLRDSNLTPSEKRARLDALAAEKNALLKGAVSDVKAASK